MLSKKGRFYLRGNGSSSVSDDKVLFLCQVKTAQFYIRQNVQFYIRQNAVDLCQSKVSVSASLI